MVGEALQFTVTPYTHETASALNLRYLSCHLLEVELTLVKPSGAPRGHLIESFFRIEAF
jgi:hypothetical protein